MINLKLVLMFLLEIVQAKQKHSPSGVVLSNDVLTLDLAAGTDHSLIMALITVYGLICGIM